MAARNVYSIRLELTPVQARLISGGEGGAKEVEVIERFANAAVTKLADGGYVIAAAPRARIEKVIGRMIEKPEDIVNAVEEGASMDGDNTVVSAALDPLYVDELKEKARVCGMTLDVLVSDLFSQAIHMGMFYDMETERIPIFLTPDQHAAIKAQFGIAGKVALTGDQLVRCLRLKGMELVDTK
jgi:hypothetical protein